MTDLEMTKLCAEAMGIRVDGDGIYGGVACTFTITKDETTTYNDAYYPLGNDAQAMALVKKFGLRILCYTVTHGWDVQFYKSQYSHEGDARGYHATDLNRAICECVAKMQKAKSAVHTA